MMLAGAAGCDRDRHAAATKLPPEERPTTTNNSVVVSGKPHSPAVPFTPSDAATAHSTLEQWCLDGRLHEGKDTVLGAPPAKLFALSALTKVTGTTLEAKPIAQVLCDHFTAVRACFEAHASTTSEVDGSLLVSVAIPLPGAPIASLVREGGTLSEDPRLLVCLSSVFSELPFPKGTAGQTFIYKMRVKPPDPAKPK